jgi:hypothetical protein
MNIYVMLVNHVYGPLMLAMMLVDIFAYMHTLYLFCDWEIRLRYRGDSIKTSRQDKG